MLEIMAARVLTALIDAPGFAGCFGREYLSTLQVHAMSKNMIYMALGLEALHLDRAIYALMAPGVVIHEWHNGKSLYVLAESAYKLTPEMFSLPDVKVSKLFLRRIALLERIHHADRPPSPQLFRLPYLPT